jgi:ATP:ADP antiporter, AAA family
VGASVSSKFNVYFKSLFNIEREERLKLLLLGSSFFLVIGAYTLARELKSSMFMSIVGKEYVPMARMLAMLLLIPATLFYSFLVDKIKRYQLLYFYSIAYGLAGLACVYLVGHSSIGLPNTETSPYRLFGWFFYIFIEVFSPFLISVFWAFSNSVYSPEGAKNSYAVLVSASKVGGMVTAGAAWIMFSWRSMEGTKLFTDVISHQFLLALFSLLALIIPFIVYILIKKVPKKYLHGYEAAYQFEKEKEKLEKHEGKEKVGIFSGLVMLVKCPYILGIFGMLFFYEVVSTVLSYHRLGVAQDSAADISGVSGFLFKVAFIQHFFGILISFLGTRTLLRVFGERICLLLVPGIASLSLLYFILSYTPFAVVLGIILLQAINYAFAQPVRESLYIPTLKDIKFKSKSWIDAFGSRFAKSVGSTFVIAAESMGPAMFFPLHSVFFAGIIVCWFITAFFLGKRYTRAIKNNEVIGVEEAQESVVGI